MLNLLMIYLVGQRLLELGIAKKNEIWMRRQGAMEYGNEHYHLIVLMHCLFFISFYGEGFGNGGEISPYWYILFPMFLLLQAGRAWVIHSLGPYWNTKILVLPKGIPQTKGPYRYIKHPNYLIVAFEFIVIPLLFEAYMTAFLFTIFNAVMMVIRIRTEEEALSLWNEYNLAFQDQSRFIPKFHKGKHTEQPDV